MDKSNGYESVSRDFIRMRGNLHNTIGVSAVEQWGKSLPEHSSILDLGCGCGLPISRTLIEQGFGVYGIDASPTLAAAFKKNFPNHEIRCESVEESSFFDMEFDGVVAWGLLFLLPVEVQVALIGKLSKHIRTGGKLLFTSPQQEVRWKDALTGLFSVSLGSGKYRELLSKNGFRLVKELVDEGENHYYSATKIR